jgi:DNA repair protein RadC
METIEIRRVVSRFSADVVRVREGEEGIYGSFLHTPRGVAGAAAKILDGEAQEVLIVFFLSQKREVLGYAEASRGTLTSSLVDPRMIFAPAMRMGNVAGVVVAHNHPSGDPFPSAEDVEVTRRLRSAGQILGIELVDHVIVGCGSDRVHSLRESHPEIWRA